MKPKFYQDINFTNATKIFFNKKPIFSTDITKNQFFLQILQMNHTNFYSHTQSKKNVKSENALSLRKKYANEYFSKGFYNSNSTLKFYKHHFVLDGISKGSKGARSYAEQIMSHILSMFKSRTVSGEFLYTSFASIADHLGSHPKIINKWMSILRKHDYIRYEVLWGQKVESINGYEFNLKVSLNINKIPSFETGLIRYLKKLIGEEDLCENSYEENCEKIDTKNPETVGIDTTLSLVGSDNLLLPPLYIQDSNIIKQRDIEDKIFEIESCIEKRVINDKSDSCTKSFPLEVKESEKAKEFRKAFKESFGELIYRRYMGNHVQLVEFEHECKKKRRKFGIQLLLRFKNAEVRKDFLYLYGKLYELLSKLIQEHKVVFGSFYERFAHNPDVKRLGMHDIDALDESTRAKQARHDFCTTYGEDIYIAWLLDCKFEFIENELFLICPNSYIQTRFFTNYSDWYEKQGLDESNVIVIN